MGKLIIFLTGIFIGISVPVYAQSPSDTTRPSTPSGNVSVPLPTSAKAAAASYNFVDTSYQHGLLICENGKCMYYARRLDGWQYLLVFLPVLLFGAILLYVLARLSQEEFKLSDMLSEDPLPGASADSPPPRSTSRLIAFLSGLMAVTIGTCATCYYFYIILKTGQAPSLESLFNILLGLGFGVVPYAVNQLSSIFSTTKSNTRYYEKDNS